MTKFLDSLKNRLEGLGGFLMRNGDQVLVRSLVPDYGIEIDNPSGIGGNPVIRAAQGQVLLGSLLGANFNSTADQIIQVVEFPKYIITDILVTNASADPTTAVGGFYSAPSKAGYTLVAAGQAYSGLSDVGLVKSCTLGAAASRVLTGPNVYLSLTTPQGSALTADVLVFGKWLKA